MTIALFTHDVNFVHTAYLFVTSDKTWQNRDMAFELTTLIVTSAEGIIRGISEADGTIKALLAKYKISAFQFYKALEQSLILRTEYSIAQEARSEVWADEIVDIADTEPCPQTARNRIDARKWYASKLLPKKFGERIDISVFTTVDIRGALDEAKQRVLPAMTPAQRAASQVIDITAQRVHAPTDSESVDIYS